LQLQLPITVAVSSHQLQLTVTIAVSSRQFQLPVAQTLILEDKLDGATNFRGMHLYMFTSYIISQRMRVFAGDVQGTLSKQ
jgi:hypothetical protein